MITGQVEGPDIEISNIHLEWMPGKCRYIEKIYGIKKKREREKQYRTHKHFGTWELYRGTHKSYPEERKKPREQKILRKNIISEVKGRESSKKTCSDMMKVTSGKIFTGFRN